MDRPVPNQRPPQRGTMVLDLDDVLVFARALFGSLCAFGESTRQRVSGSALAVRGAGVRRVLVRGLSGRWLCLRR